jgi:hypothetical protein
MRERRNRGGRAIRPIWRSLVNEMVDSLPLPAAIITDFERPQWAMRTNAVLLPVFGPPSTTDGSIGLGEILNRRNEPADRLGAAITEVWKSGRPYHNRVDTHPRSHIALWACRIGLPEPLGVLVVATLLPKPTNIIASTVEGRRREGASNNERQAWSFLEGVHQGAARKGVCVYG